MVHRTPFILPLLYPSLVWRMPVKEKVLYLTFDDGPVPGPTDFVLEQLQRFNAKATFFCIGDNIRKHPDVFRAIVNNGHSVGNHTFNHLNGWKTEFSQYRSNTEECSDIMTKYQSPKPTLFRPPYGRITRRQIRGLSDFKIIMWDVLTVDYNARQSPEHCLYHSIRATRNGSIIVFHDSFKAEKSLRFALPGFLKHFTSQGYRFREITS